VTVADGLVTKTRYNAAMTDAELKRLAERTGIPIKKIAEWHFVHARDGMPRKRPRPKGTLSINDIMERGIPYQTIHEWRRAGLKTKQMGKMVLVRESDLNDWLAEHPAVRRGRQRGLELSIPEPLRS